MLTNEDKGYLRLKHVILLTFGYFFFILGVVGTLLPVMPTTPFLIVAYVFFSKGSPRFHNWFISTKLYKEYLEELVTNRTMPFKRKLIVCVPVSISLVISAIYISHLYFTIAIIAILACVYLFFFWFIK